jgi:hypothetical protein
MKKLLIISTLVLVYGAGAHAATYHVIPGGGGDAGTIQAGIDLASNGDIVMVAPGTYRGAGNVNLNFNGKNITLQSDAGAGQTIIDCQQAAPGIRFANGEGFDAVLDGFTIKNARGNKGAGIYVSGASPMICYCVLTNCYAFNTGGGMYVLNGSPTVFNNTFDDDGAAFGGGAFQLASGSNVQIYQNIICGTTSGGAFGFSSAGGGTFISCNDLYANTGGSTISTGDAGYNYAKDPLFCGIPGSGNYFLQQTSPCTSAFSPCLTTVGALGIQCDVTAIEPVTWGKVKSMYR